LALSSRYIVGSDSERVKEFAVSTAGCGISGTIDLILTTVLCALYNTRALQDSTRSGAVLKHVRATGIPMKVEIC
jgi:hypothetical protein